MCIMTLTQDFHLCLAVQCESESENTFLGIMYAAEWTNKFWCKTKKRKEKRKEDPHF